MMSGFVPAAVLAAAMVTVTSGGALAATVVLESVTGTFLDDAEWQVLEYRNGSWQPSFDVAPDAMVRRVDTPESTEIWWGDPRTPYSSDKTFANEDARQAWFDTWGSQQSGYSFKNLTAEEAFETTPFNFGLARHDNGILWGDSTVLSSVTMRVDIRGRVEDRDDQGNVLDSDSFELMVDFFLGHDETNNNQPPCPIQDTSGTPCGDTVGITGQVAFSSEAIVSGQSHELRLVGLVDTLQGSNTILSFFSDEGSYSEAMFRAELVSTDLPPPIPLPAPAWMLLAGIGGLAVAGRRRRQA